MYVSEHRVHTIFHDVDIVDYQEFDLPGEYAWVFMSLRCMTNYSNNIMHLLWYHCLG